MKVQFLLLTSPKLRTALNRKHKSSLGFSLIELVVVIAVLAVLIAIALPNFLGVQRDAKVSSAKNTLTNIIKECAVKSSRGGPEQMGDQSNPNGLTGAPVATAYTDLNGYNIVPRTPNAPLAVARRLEPTDSCMQAAAAPDTPNELATYAIAYDGATGAIAKTCYAAQASTYKEGCFRLRDLTGGSVNPGAVGFW